MAENTNIRISIQNKINRLIDGKRSARDLDAIFLWLRPRTFGAKTVKDIGDFVAHADEKDRGVVWDHASLLSPMFRDMSMRLGESIEKSEADLRNHKARVMAAFKLDDAAAVRRGTGFGQRKAKNFLIGALSKINFVDGEYFAPNFSAQERLVYHRYSRVIVVAPAYDEARLVSDFITCLKKNSMMHEDQEPAIQSASQFIAVYAIEKMHFCNLIIDNTPASSLKATISREDEGHLLGVYCHTNTVYKKKKKGILTEIFSTTCKASDWLDDTLWNGQNSGEITVPIEISTGGRLTVAD